MALEEITPEFHVNNKSIIWNLNKTRQETSPCFQEQRFMTKNEHTLDQDECVVVILERKREKMV